jgi:TPR repeat protein
VFLQARDALARMQSFAKELKWSRVTKEHGLLAKELRLPGEKGRKLLADLREVAQAAVAAERTLGETRACLAKAGAAREFKQALELCRQVLTLDPSDALAAARLPELAVTTVRAGVMAQHAAMLRLAEAKKLVAVRQMANEILEQGEVLTAWTEPDRLLGLNGVTGAAVRSETEAVLAAADQAATAASAAVEAGQEAMAEKDYRTAKAKADEALALCADLPAAAELRQQCEVGLDGLRQLVVEVRTRVNAARELTEAGRLAEARTALASLVAEYGEVAVPEDADAAPEWIKASTDLATAEEEIAERERQNLRQRQKARWARIARTLAIVLPLTGVVLSPWIGEVLGADVVVMGMAVLVLLLVALTAFLLFAASGRRQRFFGVAGVRRVRLAAACLTMAQMVLLVWVAALVWREHRHRAATAKDERLLAAQYAAYMDAAEQGDATAQTNLGRCYGEGIGVARDDRQAVRWYRMAAEKGDAQAQRQLSLHLEYGIGTDKDYTEAEKWCRRAAEQGNVDAQVRLAEYCVNDLAEAFMWYRKAAEKGDPHAEGWLAFCYGNGRGVVKDDAEAVRWLRKAAGNGDAGWQRALGEWYEKGTHIPRDEREAIKWYREAARQGNSAADAALERLGVR